MSALLPADAPRATLERLLRLGRRRHRTAAALAAAGAWLPAVALATALAGRAGVPIGASLAVLAALLAWRFLRAHAVDLATLTARLDRRLPALEHSAELLAAAPTDLGPVARLQRARAARALAALDDLERAVATTSPARASMVFGAGLVSTVLIVWLAPAIVPAPASDAAVLAAAPPSTAPPAPAVEALVLTIEPPVYTGRSARSVVAAGAGADSVAANGVAVAEGAQVTLVLRTSGPPTAAELLLDDRALAFTPGADGALSAHLTVTASHVFRARLVDTGGGELATTPYGRLRMVPDRPPSVTIDAPPLVTQVDAGSLGLAVRATVADDYGVARTALVATLALGAGEMVQFREQRLAMRRLGSPADGGRLLASDLDLGALGLEPGGELYFFVEAWDNRPGEAQRSRSATHLVRWPGVTTSSVDLGAGLPMILPPETFRSQRQIIIDTERLLAERARLDAATFARRARVIALDQHALRLRYGAMLGDEFIDGRPVGVAERPEGKARHDDAPGTPADDHPDDHGHAAENGGLAFGDADGGVTTRPIDLAGELEGDLVHAHDSEESATFFTTETKRVLKSSLANMWEAELQLHLADAEAALPYEYRALRLLKEVQQASRVYVRRVGFETPPLDPDRRLTGDLDEVPSRHPRLGVEAKPERPAIRAALVAVGGAVGSPAATSAAIEAAIGELLEPAGAPDLEALDRLRDAAATLRAHGVLGAEHRRAVAAVLWRQLGAPERVPDREVRPDDELAAAFRAARAGAPASGS